MYTGYKYSLDGINYVVNDNEILEIKAVYNTGQVVDQKFTDTYNSLGFPLQQIVTVNGVQASIVVFNYISE